MKTLTKELLKAEPGVRAADLRKTVRFGEALFRAGEKLTIFVPVYYSSVLKENNGQLSIEDWLDALDDAVGSNVKGEVEDFANDNEDKESFCFNENGHTQDDFERKRQDMVDAGEKVDPERLKEFEGPYNKNLDGDEYDESKIDMDMDEAFEGYVLSNFRGRYDRFARNFQADRADAREFPSSGELDACLETAIEDFNSSNLAQYAENQGLKSVKMVGCGELIGDQLQSLDGDFGAHPVGIAVEAEFEAAPDDDTVKTFLTWLEGQMSDGWGEGFEQQTCYEDPVFEYSLSFRGPDLRRTREISITRRASTDSLAMTKTKEAGQKIRGVLKKLAPMTNKFRAVAKESGRRLKKAVGALRGESTDYSMNSKTLVNQLLEGSAEGHDYSPARGAEERRFPRGGYMSTPGTQSGHDPKYVYYVNRIDHASKIGNQEELDKYKGLLGRYLMANEINPDDMVKHPEDVDALTTQIGGRMTTPGHWEPHSKELVRSAKERRFPLNAESKQLVRESEGDAAELAARLKEMSPEERDSELDAWFEAALPGELENKVQSLLAALGDPRGAKSQRGQSPAWADQTESRAKALVNRLLEGDGQPGYDLPSSPTDTDGPVCPSQCCADTEMPFLHTTRLKYEAEIGAPGSGQSYSCPRCHKSFIKIGDTVIDTEDWPEGEAPPGEMDPADCV